MPKSARALSAAPQANDPEPGLIATSPTAASRKRAPGKAELATAKGEAVLAMVKADARPLLIGAGVGAALALSVVALRSREKQPTLALFASPNSTFLSMVVKTAAFAIGRVSAHDSLAHVLARAVSKTVD
jgi:hypothetical protein